MATATLFSQTLGSDAPSGHTIKRLNRAGISPEGLTESSGRKLLRDQQKLKPPTSRQTDYLRTHLGKSGDGLTRGQAEELIRQHDRIVRAEEQRLKEAPEIQACNERLEELKAPVHELAPDWTPPNLTDLNSLSCYVEVVENALDHATGFDLVELQSDPFFEVSAWKPATILSLPETQQPLSFEGSKLRSFALTLKPNLRSSII